MQKLNLLIIVLCIFIFDKVELMAYEEPDYKVLSEFEEFEIREYSAYLVAETEIDSSFEEASNVGFWLLFIYISGENQKQEKIKMTIPVNQSNSDNSGVKIDMTTPVSQKVNLKSDGKYKVSFVIPSKFNLDNVPIPRDPRFKICEIPKRIMAVVEYSGTWSEENY